MKVWSGKLTQALCAFTVSAGIFNEFGQEDRIVNHRPSS
jgi:hypothetical protein